MDRSTTRPGPRSLLAAAFSIVIVTGAVGVGVGSAAQARVVTCQGLTATVVGPTNGQDTTGTEDDDVIVAPLGPNSTVQGLGGNDTICLVDGPPSTSRDPFVIVRAGAGNDSVVNEAAVAPPIRVALGTGSDSFVGAAYAESVFTANPYGLANTDDTEVDVIDTRGGDDQVVSGTPGFPNHDVISTGDGHDAIGYGGLAGGAIDNGSSPDWLVVVDEWAGDLNVDNVQRKATIGASTVLTWTAVDSFEMRAVPGSFVTFTGSDADELLVIAGTVRDVTAPTGIATGGGDDSVNLENYLPSEVDAGDGYDYLGYRACYRAYVALDVSAECITHDQGEVSTALAGIENFLGSTKDGLTVQGSDAADRIRAYARFVLVRSGPGADRVYALGFRKTQVVGGRGDDRLRGPGKGVTIFGGRGSDFLVGGNRADRLFGGLGNDTAYGKRGLDRCVAEVRVGCEL